MKKLALILVLLSGVYLTAQRHEGKRIGIKDLNAEQMANLQTKKMTLALDLNHSQQKEVASILLADAELRKTKQEERKNKREEDTRPTKEERFAMQSERLDHMITHKANIKKILTKEQFVAWEKIQHKRQRGRKGRGQTKAKR